MKLYAHGLHLIMMTEKELCVYDPITKKILQLYENKSDLQGRYFALGGCKGIVCSIYNSNASKKGSKYMIELHKEIDFESQIENILKQGEIELANKLFTI